MRIMLGRKNHILNKLNKGFSLVETLVAITILLLAVGGPLTIAHRALSDARIAKNQTTAIFLTQDAIEYIRNIRDQNNIAGSNWLASISVCSGVCVIDSAANTITVCGGSCPKLRYDQTTGLYGYDPSWEETTFTRTVTLNTLTDGESSVSVDMDWSNGALSRSLSGGGNILNWGAM